MIVFLVLMEITDSTLIAPGVGLATFSGLMLAAAKAYKEARHIDVEGERKRRQEAEAREAATGATNSTKLDELSSRIRALEEKIDQMRIAHETALLDERGKNFQLRKLLRENGVKIPEELGPS